MACRLDLKASIAAPPVSPEVAPTMVARVPRLVERRIHHPRQELHRHVLEGERRPMEELEQPVIAVELLERRHGRVAETAHRRPSIIARRRSGGMAPSVKREMTA